MSALYSEHNDKEKIYFLNADVSDPRNLTHGLVVDADPARSLKGIRIAFLLLRDRNNEIYLIDIERNNLQRLSGNGYNGRGFDMPSRDHQISMAARGDGNPYIHLVDFREVFQ